MCKRLGCYHSASKIHVRDRIIKLCPNQFMPQWFIRFPEFTEFSEFLFHLGKTPLSLLNHNQNVYKLFTWTFGRFFAATEMFSEHIQLLMIFRIFINLVIVIVFFQKPNKYKWNVEKINIIQASFFSFFLQNLLGIFYILEKVYWDVVVEFVNIVHLCCTCLSGQRENVYATQILLSVCLSDWHHDLVWKKMGLSQKGSNLHFKS